MRREKLSSQASSSFISPPFYVITFFFGWGLYLRENYYFCFISCLYIFLCQNRHHRQRIQYRFLSVWKSWEERKTSSLTQRREVGGGSEVISLVTRISLGRTFGRLERLSFFVSLGFIQDEERKVEEGTSKTLICTSVRLDYDQYSGSGSSLRWWMRTVILLIMPPILLHLLDILFPSPLHFSMCIYFTLSSFCLPPLLLSSKECSQQIKFPKMTVE